MRAEVVEREEPVRNPIRGIFVRCCATTGGWRAKSMVQRVRTVICFFMLSFLLLPPPQPVLSMVEGPVAYYHLITRSALTNTFGGIVRVICLAAFRLMINSNFFGCSTTRSWGLAPLRILST